MALISFNKANNLAVPDDLRIEVDAALYVEPSRPDLMRLSMIRRAVESNSINSCSDPIRCSDGSALRARAPLPAGL